MTVMDLYRLWRERDAATRYIVGFAHKGLLYRLDMREIPPELVRLNRASSRKHGMLTLRLQLTAATRELLVAAGAQLVGPENLLDDPKLNKGEAWERLVVEAAGLTWAKDNTPYWVAGDIRLDGEEVQIKFNHATLTTAHALGLS